MYRDQETDKNKNHNNNLQELIVETTYDNNIMDRHNEEDENGDSVRRTVTTSRQPDDDPPIPARQPDSTPAAVNDGASEPPMDFDFLPPLSPNFGYTPSTFEDPFSDFGCEALYENPNPDTSDKSPTVVEPPVPARQPDSTSEYQATDTNKNNNFQEAGVGTNNNDNMDSNKEEQQQDTFFQPLTPATGRTQPDADEPPLPASQPDAEEPPIPASQPDAEELPIPVRQYPELFYQLKHLNPNLEEELRRRSNCLRRNCRCKTSLLGRKSAKSKKRGGLGVQSLTVKPLPVRRRRSNPKHGLRPDKCPTVNPPYPWATDRRATVHTMAELESREISTVEGKVKCKKCERTFDVEYDLKTEGGKLITYMAENKASLSDRSAPEWDTPAWLDCTKCGRKECVKGVVAENKRDINWLFLFLGGFLCCCTIEQLKYFCKHTGNHRTGAKNRLLYLTYLGLCKQLQPSGPFDPPSI